MFGGPDRIILRVFLLNSAYRARRAHGSCRAGFRWCFASDGNAGVDGDHFGEDVEHGLVM